MPLCLRGPDIVGWSVAPSRLFHHTSQVLGAVAGTATPLAKAACASSPAPEGESSFLLGSNIVPFRPSSVEMVRPRQRPLDYCAVIAPSRNRRALPDTPNLCCIAPPRARRH